MAKRAKKPPAREDAYPPVARYQARMRRGCATARDMTPEVVEDLYQRSKQLAGTGQFVMLAPAELEHLIVRLRQSEAALEDARARLRTLAKEMYE